MCITRYSVRIALTLLVHKLCGVLLLITKKGSMRGFVNLKTGQPLAGNVGDSLYIPPWSRVFHNKILTLHCIFIVEAKSRMPSNNHSHTRRFNCYHNAHTITPIPFHKIDQPNNRRFQFFRINTARSCQGKNVMF